jgi:hypothetical protein
MDHTLRPTDIKKQKTREGRIIASYRPWCFCCAVGFCCANSAVLSFWCCVLLAFPSNAFSQTSVCQAGRQKKLKGCSTTFQKTTYFTPAFGSALSSLPPHLLVVVASSSSHGCFFTRRSGHTNGLACACGPGRCDFCAGCVSIRIHGDRGISTSVLGPDRHMREHILVG